MTKEAFAQLRWGKENIQEFLRLSDHAVNRAVLAIYQRQTDSERGGRTAEQVNGVGFNKYDAEWLTPIAERLEAGLCLTDNEIRRVRPAMMKYWRQLAEIANERRIWK